MSNKPARPVQPAPKPPEPAPAPKPDAPPLPPVPDPPEEIIVVNDLPRDDPERAGRLTLYRLQSLLLAAQDQLDKLLVNPLYSGRLRKAAVAERGPIGPDAKQWPELNKVMGAVRRVIKNEPPPDGQIDTSSG